ncbi:MULTISPECIES: hypothetical protein [Pseudidiomarina]|uniref:Uncharacterized protein n=1 Tax=Pseudidiomarina tainanensis TaxID=502365 RepID=A0A368UTZ7_9GAMM|nr:MULTISPECIES: hypothetical protein [Pseudidiomarina]RBP90487.1 hypothetical protein DFO81_107107 [Pseudidiomarina tainanensis]RCW32163.1 hypothetical protein DFO79_107107 [Pseudidiomarina tainanensis]
MSMQKLIVMLTMLSLMLMPFTASAAGSYDNFAQIQQQGSMHMDGSPQMDASHACCDGEPSNQLDTDCGGQCGDCQHGCSHANSAMTSQVITSLPLLQQPAWRSSNSLIKALISPLLRPPMGF